MSVTSNLAELNNILTEQNNILQNEINILLSDIKKYAKAINAVTELEPVTVNGVKVVPFAKVIEVLSTNLKGLSKIS